MIADCQARISVLEARRVKNHVGLKFWENMTPRGAWMNRRRNAIRMFRAILSVYEIEKKQLGKDYAEMFPTGMHYLALNLLLEEVTIQTIVWSGIWPVLFKNGKRINVRGVQSDKYYDITKRVFGKGNQCFEGSDLNWFLEALEEVGMPETMYSRRQIKTVASEFHEGLISFSGEAAGQQGWRELRGHDVPHPESVEGHGAGRRSILQNCHLVTPRR